MMRSALHLALVLTVVASALGARQAAAQPVRGPNDPRDTRLDGPELIESATSEAPPRAMNPNDDLGEPPPTHFADSGAFVLTGDTAMGFESTSYSKSDASSLAVTFSPSFDYFLANDIGMGLVFPVAYRRSQAEGVESSRTSYGLGVRLSGNVRMSERFSLWLQGSMIYDHGLTKIDAAGVAPVRVADNGFAIELAAPVLFHVAPHLFAGFGPSLHHDFSRTLERTNASNERTTIGASLVVGCWF